MPRKTSFDRSTHISSSVITQIICGGVVQMSANQSKDDESSVDSSTCFGFETGSSRKSSRTDEDQSQNFEASQISSSSNVEISFLTPTPSNKKYAGPTPRYSLTRLRKHPNLREKVLFLISSQLRFRKQRHQNLLKIQLLLPERS